MRAREIDGTRGNIRNMGDGGGLVMASWGDRTGPTGDPRGRDARDGCYVRKEATLRWAGALLTQACRKNDANVYVAAYRSEPE